VEINIIMKTKIDRLEEIAQEVGNTPLREIKNVLIPNENRIFVKGEWADPTGSHYDRIYLELFRSLEREGKIVRGKSRLIETTSGCVGTSFAWFGRELGYSCTVIIPADSPENRQRLIRSYGAELIFSPAGKYIRGAKNKLIEVLKSHRATAGEEGDRFNLLNHSEDFRSIEAMRQVAVEACQHVTGGDHFVGVCRNGARLLVLQRRY
jgi:cysteine synthase